MNAVTDLVAPFIWTCSGLAALLSLAGLGEGRKALRTLSAALLMLAALALIAALALPELLPVRSAMVHPDGTTDDPRALATLLLGAAALVSLLPAWRSLRLAAVGSLSLLLPGIVLAGLFGAVASFVKLHHPMALAGMVLGALTGATAVVLAFRTRAAGHAPAAIQAFATAALVVAGMLSLHGARLGGMNIAEGAGVDTLGTRLYFAGVEAPNPGLRVLRVVLYGERDSLRLSPELRGAAGRNVTSIADASWWSGPIVVPIALEERRARAHDVQWADKTTPLKAGDATILLVGFRFVKGDTIRMYADLDVTTPAGKRRVSPGVLATAHGEVPFAADAPGFGPIAVAGIDADHGRVGLMLPRLSESNVSRVASLDLRLRPALAVAWAGAALALIAFVFGMASRPAVAARR